MPYTTPFTRLLYWHVLRTKWLCGMFCRCYFWEGWKQEIVSMKTISSGIRVPCMRLDLKLSSDPHDTVFVIGAPSSSYLNWLNAAGKVLKIWQYANQITFFTCVPSMTDKNPHLHKLFLTTSQQAVESHWDASQHHTGCNLMGISVIAMGSWSADTKEWKIAHVCKATYFCTYYSAEMGHAKKTIHQTFGRMKFVMY